VAATSEVINLGLGHPGLPLLPVALMRDSAQELFAGGEAQTFQYRDEAGSPGFRRALAHFLARADGAGEGGRTPAPEELFVTGGVSQALDLLCTLYAAPGDLVFVEEPTYFLALRIFRDHGLEVQSVPTDGDGMDVDALEDRLRGLATGRRAPATPAGGERRRPALVYTIPVHQNPGGSTLSEERRRRLIELAEQWNLLILADEVYQLLTYEGTPPASFGRFAETERVCALGSFSKILAPGVRMGWIHAGPGILRDLVGCGLIQSGGGVANFPAAMVAAALTHEWLDDHLARLRREYATRRDALLEVLDQYGAERGVTFTRPPGGYFVWAQLPPDTRAEELLARAREAGVTFLPGPHFSVTGGLERNLRLSFSYNDRGTVAEGARRLVSALDR
jgi:DNA-binding transcriptional MocR family regulator